MALLQCIVEHRGLPTRILDLLTFSFDWSYNDSVVTTDGVYTLFNAADASFVVINDVSKYKPAAIAQW